MSRNNRAIATLGPTAVGKSQIAIRLAMDLQSEIVSCDSVQAYRYLNIGSAKLPISEQCGIPHHLIDVFDPDVRIDVGMYKTLAEKHIAEIRAKGYIPIVCGGTGMYFNALYYGLFEGPGRNEEIRSELKRRYKEEGPMPLYEELTVKDPETASKIEPNDFRRIERALEVIYLTGIPFSKARDFNKKPELEWLLIGLNIDRTVLYERINKRVVQMMQDGLVAETEALLKRYGDQAPGLGSIGYAECIRLIRGEWDEKTCIEAIQQNTRHYAKRQMTWFRKNKDIVWFSADDYSAISDMARRFLEA